MRKGRSANSGGAVGKDVGGVGGKNHREKRVVPKVYSSFFVSGWIFACYIRLYTLWGVMMAKMIYIDEDDDDV